MPFHLYTGNKLELLAKDKLCGEVLCVPLSDPFKKEKIIIQNHGMSVWLKQQIASNNKICANYDFLFINDFLKEILSSTLTESQLPDFEYYEEDAMSLKIYDILSEIKDHYFELSSYIKGDNIELKQFQLASRIASSFDQYQIYRPDMILEWESGKCADEHKWQADIWQKLSKGRVSRSRGLVDFIENADLSKLDIERLTVFGISSMPPLYLEVFQKLASSDTIDVHFFLLNPCEADWQIKTIKQNSPDSVRDIARLNPYTEETSLNEGNYLLEAFGRSGREFYSLLCSIEKKTEQVLFEASEGESILSSIHSDILSDSRSKRDYKYDSSVQIHNCHSPMREIEVLYDNLLDMINKDISIQQRDIFVMTPDIPKYMPYIRAVFDRRNNEQGSGAGLSYAFADVTLSQSSRLINTYFVLFSLKNSKFKIDDLLDILDAESIRKKFGLNDEESPALIRKWMEESGMRWGVDAKGRKEAGYPEFSENSLSTGVDRLLLGYAMEDDDAFYRDSIIPYNDIEISGAKLLGGLAGFLKAVFTLKEILSGVETISGWKNKLVLLLEQFFENDNETFSDISKLVKAINHLESCSDVIGFDTKVPVEIVKTYLRDKVDSEILREGFLKGSITFCTMLPMRNIPGKVVCIIGMEDGAYPRKETRLGFNLMDENPALCDKSKRFEDRYIFLEAILAARKILYISYVGQNNRTNEIMPPASPVCELIDYLKGVYGNFSIEKDIVIRHKLHSFDALYFNNDSVRHFSYSKTERISAETLLKEHKSKFLFDDEGISHEQKITQISIDELISFFKNPSKSIINRGLGAELGVGRTISELGMEPFEFDFLELYKLNQDILNSLRSGEDPEHLYKRYKFENKLPVGIKGKMIFDQQVSVVESCYRSKENNLGISPEEALTSTEYADFDLDTGDGIKLYGRLENIKMNDSQVFFQVGSKNGSRVMESWIRHLIFVASGFGVRTYSFIGKKSSKDMLEVYSSVDKEGATELLKQIIGYYVDGMRTPLPFFPKTSYAYAKAKPERKKYEAYKAFCGDDYMVEGELTDLNIALCFDETVIENKKFEECAFNIFPDSIKM